MELYLSLKFTIKYTDIRFIKQAIAYYCLVFASNRHNNYTNLSLYLTRLLIINTANPPLKRALFANILINYYKTKESWFNVN